MNLPYLKVFVHRAHHVHFLPVTSRLTEEEELTSSSTNSTSESSTNSSTAGTTTGNVTLTDITQFQLNLWTGVFLVLLGFLAIYATATMDVQPDSLLYAKFITDTSGGGLKTD